MKNVKLFASQKKLAKKTLGKYSLKTVKGGAPITLGQVPAG